MGSFSHKGRFSAGAVGKVRAQQINCNTTFYRGGIQLDRADGVKLRDGEIETSWAVVSYGVWADKMKTYPDGKSSPSGVRTCTFEVGQVGIYRLQIPGYHDVVFQKNSDDDVTELTSAELKSLVQEVFKVEITAAFDRVKALEDQREAERASALSAAQQAGLPLLKGSDKQIAWALTLRASRHASHPQDPALKGEITAKYWIDHRFQ